MITLKHSRTEAAIDQNFRDLLKREFEKELMEERRQVAAGDLQQQKFKSTRWKKAKEQLQVETGGKCAYCEASVTAVAFGDVEHYRPKSKYWWLAYCYDNYLASCQLCNQAFKKDVFPIKNSKLRGPVIRKNTTDAFIEQNCGKIAPDPLSETAVEAFKELHRQEGALLLNPYFDEPERYYAWRADDALEEVELIPMPGVAEAADYCKAAEKYYGLNRRRLKRLRYATYTKFQLFRRLVDEPGISQQSKAEVKAQIEKMKAASHEFAGMVSFFDKQGFG